MSNNRIYIRVKSGGGFWVDKEEYEDSIAGATGVETGQPEDIDKYKKESDEVRDIEVLLKDNHTPKNKERLETRINDQIEKISERKRNEKDKEEKQKLERLQDRLKKLKDKI